VRERSLRSIEVWAKKAGVSVNIEAPLSRPPGVEQSKKQFLWSLRCWSQAWALSGNRCNSGAAPQSVTGNELSHGTEPAQNWFGKRPCIEADPATP